MKTGSVDLRSPAIVGLVLTLPLILLEFVFRVFVRPDPRFILDSQWLLGLLALFGFLWTLPFVFAVISRPLLREVRTDVRTLARPLLVMRVVVLVLIALLWGSLVLDQLPCFLAIPNCD